MGVALEHGPQSATLSSPCLDGSMGIARTLRVREWARLDVSMGIARTLRTSRWARLDVSMGIVAAARR